MDENLPKGLWKTMRAAGYSAARLIDEGLLGKPDSAIFRQVRLRATILTRDKDFLHAELFPTPHSGIIVVNLPNNAPVAVVVREVMNAVTELEVRLLANKAYIIEPGLVRLWS